MSCPGNGVWDSNKKRRLFYRLLCDVVNLKPSIKYDMGASNNGLFARINFLSDRLQTNNNKDFAYVVGYEPCVYVCTHMVHLVPAAILNEGCGGKCISWLAVWVLEEGIEVFSGRQTLS